jgi:hypothetical protein
LLDNYSFWYVGDGSVIDAWKDAWIEEGLWLDRQLVIPSNLQGYKVCDLIDDEGRWNWNLFANWMPDIIKKKIAAIPPPNVTSGRDERAGVGGKRSDFSVAVQ